MNHTGKPDAGNPPVRFDEGDGHGEGRGHLYSTSILYFQTTSQCSLWLCGEGFFFNCLSFTPLG